nr:tRNA (N6-threonylcarbamoyladenosine(37)-N6)-methyltransferase TrmO [Desulfobulbaceae bacterium]
MSKITLEPIGILHCGLTKTEHTPKSFTESSESGTLEIDDQYLPGLDGIKPGDTIIVLFWFNQANRSLLKVHPRGDTSRPIRGVFSTRSPARPNPIAISELLVTAISGTMISVTGVDALDQTPILDIKKNLCSKDQ